VERDDEGGGYSLTWLGGSNFFHKTKTPQFGGT
jgi:hypothetical protein